MSTKGPRRFELPLDDARRHLPVDGTELGGNGVGHHHHFAFIKVVVPQDGAAGEFAGRQHGRRRLHRSIDGEAKLLSAVAREVLGMLQKADVVDANHQGHTTKDGSGVLHVQ